ncbi:MAG: PA0069 family radical SAM protein [Hellea sp.]|nr:PA0069 family radical SAM protein [Hellea sp.]
MRESQSIPFQHQRPKTEKGRGARSNRTNRFERQTRERRDDGWASLSDDFRLGTPTIVHQDKSRKIINYINSPYVEMDRSINMYRGCEHGCIYCFARPSHAFLGYSPGLDFETQLFVKSDAPKLLAKELSAPGYKVQTMHIGTNTDAYQPIERRRRLMRGILEVLQAFSHPVAVLTKSDLITRDIDILAPMAQNNLARAMISITTQDRRLSRAMEPRAPTPDKRFEALERLAGAGIPTGVMLGPMIPGLNDHEMESILERAASIGASYSAFTILWLPQEVGALFEEWLESFAPNRAARILRHIREMNGGKIYDPSLSRGNRHKGPFAKLIKNRHQLARDRLGLGAGRSENLPLDCSQFRVPPKPGDQADMFAP